MSKRCHSPAHAEMSAAIAWAKQHGHRDADLLRAARPVLIAIGYEMNRRADPLSEIKRICISGIVSEKGSFLRESQIGCSGKFDHTPATDENRGEAHDDQAERIRDLRTRLDAETTERRRIQERLTVLLTHRQSATVPAVQATMPPVALRSLWWRRWFR